LNSASFSAFYKSTKDYLQPILAALALSLAIFGKFEGTARESLVIGLVYFGIYLLTSLASRRAYIFSTRFAKKSQAVNLTFLAGGLLLVISGTATSLSIPWIGVICFILVFVLDNLRRPINVGLISDQISSRVMASGLSAEAQLTSILSALLAPLLGLLADNLGVGPGVGLIGLLMLVMYLFIRVK
jgi:hypothetical protein